MEKPSEAPFTINRSIPTATISISLTPARYNYTSNQDKTLNLSLCPLPFRRTLVKAPSFERVSKAFGTSFNPTATLVFGQEKHEVSLVSSE